MGMDVKCGKESKSIENILDLAKFKYSFNQENPDYFIPDGLLCFTGSQGTGKTLSAVNYVCRLMEKYPKCKLVTNIQILDFPIISFEKFLVIEKHLYLSLQRCGLDSESIRDVMYNHYLIKNRVFMFENNDDLAKFNNGNHGVIFLIDEIQLYMNSLESKNINMDTMVEISQQRKQRKHIVCTSQVFGRMAKPLREQFSNVVVCRCYFKMFQFNSLVDRDSLESGDNSTDTVITGEVKKKFFWIHNPKMYKRYDTYYKIQKGKFIGKEKGENLYDNGIRLSINN